MGRARLRVSAGCCGSALAVRGVIFPGERGRMYREAARSLR